MLQSTKHRLSARCNCCMVPLAATAVSRRELLAGGAAALAIGTAAGFAPTVFAQAAPHRIDVHHHVSPPTWLDAVKSMKKDNPPMYVTLAAMAQLMPISQIVYGTDFPYRTAADDTKGVTEFFKGDDLKAVDRENVIRLIPRLKAI